MCGGKNLSFESLLSRANCPSLWVSGVPRQQLLVSGQFDDASLLFHAIEGIAVARADDTAPHEVPAGFLIHGRRASAAHRM